MRTLLGALPPLAGALSLILLTALVGFAVIPEAIRPRRARLVVPAALSVGLLVLGWSGWIAGSLAGTRSIPFVWAIPALIGLRRARTLGLALRHWCRYFGLLLRASPLSSALFCLGILTCLPQVLLPVCDSDGLRYHMAFPKLYILQGRVSLYPWDVTGYLPQASEMLYLAGLATTGPETAKLLHFSVFLLSLSVLTTFLHRGRGTRSAATAAPLLLLVAPVAACPAVATFNDHFSLLPLVTAALLLSRGASPVLAGLSLGSALAAKHASAPAAVALALLGVLWSAAPAGAGKERRTARTRVRRALGTAAWFLGTALLAIAPWALRNVLATGDPFFPVGHVLLGLPIPGTQPETVRSGAVEFRAVQTGPLSLAWASDTPGAAHDDVVGWHFLVALLLLPVPALAAARARRLLTGDFPVLLALVLVNVVVRLVLHPPPRFSLSLFWALAALLAMACARLAGRLAVPLLALLVVPSWLGLGAYLFTQFEPLAYLSGRVDRETFLSRYVPGYRAARALARHPGGTVMAVDFPAPFYLDRPWIVEGILHDPPIRGWIAESRTAGEVLTRLRALSVRYLLVTPGYGGGTPITMLPLAPGREKLALVAELRSRLRHLGTFDGVDLFEVPAR